MLLLKRMCVHNFMILINQYLQFGYDIIPSFYCRYHYFSVVEVT